MTSYFKQPTPPKPPRKPLPRRSKKRAKQEAQYRADRIVFLSERPLCEMRLDGCARAATQVQHLAGRSGYRLLDQSRWMPCCASCHGRVTDLEVDAYALGLAHRRNRPGA